VTINEESKKMALEYLQKLLNGLEQGVDFAKEQVPMVAWEIIAYGRALHTFTLIASIIWIIVIAVLYNKFWKYTEEFKFEADAVFSKVMGGLVAVVLCIPGFFNFASAVGPCLKSWVAPRLYLIEYLHTLAK